MDSHRLVGRAATGGGQGLSVKDSPATEWFKWIAKIVNKIEDEGRLEEFKTEGTKYNPYREAILDDVCEQAFGSKHPTKEGVFLSHGTIVARMFARSTQGRADYPRSLKAEAMVFSSSMGRSCCRHIRWARYVLHAS